MDLFFILAGNENINIQCRGLEVLKNMIFLNKETAKKIASKGGILLFMKVIDSNSSKMCSGIAKDAIDKLKELNLLNTKIQLNV